MSLHIFGVRHHGPGCARSLYAALEALKPDIVLVEGPPDAQEVLPLLLREEMQPPVALLIYAPDYPRCSVYYPFTHFSPEWQALRYALQRNIPARFMDLPQAIQLAKKPASEETTETPPDETAPVDEQHSRASTHTTVVEPPASPTVQRDDPLAMLAEAAGYSDHELWWEQQI